MYKDKWLSESMRNYMIEYGLGSKNWWKLISKGDSGAKFRWYWESSRYTCLIFLELHFD